MFIVLQLLLTAAVYAASYFAIRRDLRCDPRHDTKSPPTPASGRRKPWLSYGLLAAAAGIFLIMSETALAGNAEEPHLLTASISLLTILGGTVVCCYGLLDK